MIGLQIKDYRVIREIGKGGMATVFLVEHISLQNRSAMKVLSQDFVRNAHIRKRFLAEARSMARMSHSGIIKVTDLMEENDTVAFVMEYIEGETLKEYIDRKGKLKDDEIEVIFSQMLEAVGYVHEHNLVHRDIKPSNFMLDKNGKIKLMDFGIAKNTDESSTEYTLTGTGMLLGTPMYMSPEQIKETRSVTAQSDIYSLGVVLWQMNTGRKPYDIKTLSSYELQTKIVNETLIATNTKWDAIIQKCTQKEIRSRFFKCAEISLSINTEFRKADSASDTTVIDSNIHGTKKEKNEISLEERFKQDSKSKEHNGNLTGDSDTTWKGFVVFAAIMLLIVVAATFSEGSDESGSSTEPESTIGRESSELGMREANEPEMVFVEGGSFSMGSDSGETDEQPVHNVQLSDFSIGKYEVTQAQWMAVMESNPSYFIKCDQCPVESVSWDDVQQFISKLNSMTGKIYRLPTEAEWEFAARGGNQSRGYEYSGSDDISAIAWYDENSGYKTHPVGQKQANELGIFDMAGNVWECCSDWYGDYSSSFQRNPGGPSSGQGRVDRGGSVGSDPQGCRGANRNYGNPVSRFNTLGFRLVLVPVR
jgi:formylglycine-generating enzyme required for sulfatase activity/tRNA A-37 threonylcarbamoyl transferase component Bud32